MCALHLLKGQKVIGNILIIRQMVTFKYLIENTLQSMTSWSLEATGITRGWGLILVMVSQAFTATAFLLVFLTFSLQFFFNQMHAFRCLTWPLQYLFALKKTSLVVFVECLRSMYLAQNGCSPLKRLRINKAHLAMERQNTHLNK